LFEFALNDSDFSITDFRQQTDGVIHRK